MPAYCRFTFEEFLSSDPLTILGQLQRAYADDGYATQFATQIRSWDTVVPLLRDELASLLHTKPAAKR